MDVKNIIDMKGDVALTIVPGATIDEASKMLRENYIGAIVVADDAGRGAAKEEGARERGGDATTAVAPVRAPSTVGRAFAAPGACRSCA